jgi:antitoxin YefM
MALETTYTRARAELAKLLDRAGQDREVVVVRRRGRPPVALVAADELESLLETAHLLRSPANARRLLSALRRALEGRGRPESPAALRRELGLGPAD